MMPITDDDEGGAMARAAGRLIDRMHLVERQLVTAMDIGQRMAHDLNETLLAIREASGDPREAPELERLLDEWQTFAGQRAA